MFKNEQQLFTPGQTSAQSRFFSLANTRSLRVKASLSLHKKHATINKKGEKALALGIHPLNLLHDLLDRLILTTGIIRLLQAAAKEKCHRLV